VELINKIWGIIFAIFFIKNNIVTKYSLLFYLFFILANFQTQKCCLQKKKKKSSFRHVPHICATSMDVFIEQVFPSSMYFYPLHKISPSFCALFNFLGCHAKEI
jgi:hypothetical protein